MLYVMCCYPQAHVQQATSAEDINVWVANATQGLIKQLMAPGTQFTALLANAVYFKGRWQHAFDTAATQQAPFFVTPGAPPVQVRRQGTGSALCSMLVSFRTKPCLQVRATD